MDLIKVGEEFEKASNELKDFLLGRESDIAQSIEDFGSLKDVFIMTFKREPRSKENEM